MTFAPNPKQALFLWKMITGETSEIREPSLGMARPELKEERKSLITHGFLETEKRGRATHLRLTDKAWSWAGQCADIELMISRGPDGTIALQGLLRRLIPYLQHEGIPLADLYEDRGGGNARSNVSSGGTRKRSAEGPTKVNAQSLGDRIRDACIALTAGRPEGDIRLTSLRSRFPDSSRNEVDAALIRMHDAGQIVLYRNDNSAEVTAEDERDALMVGGAPRHVLYLKG
jgi:hypothetical protein